MASSSSQRAIPIALHSATRPDVTRSLGSSVTSATRWRRSRRHVLSPAGASAQLTVMFLAEPRVIRPRYQADARGCLSAAPHSFRSIPYARWRRAASLSAPRLTAVLIPVRRIALFDHRHALRCDAFPSTRGRRSSERRWPLALAGAVRRWSSSGCVGDLRRSLLASPQRSRSEVLAGGFSHRQPI